LSYFQFLHFPVTLADADLGGGSGFDYTELRQNASVDSDVATIVVKRGSTGVDTTAIDELTLRNAMQ